MINPFELRLGNYVEKGKTIYKIQWASQIDNSAYCYPIELEHGLLKKLGFENDVPYPDAFTVKINFVRFEIGDLVEGERAVLFSKNGNGFVFLRHIQYLHELQNIIHALTGEELQINL
jgi:hypothetical protein